MTDIKPVAWFSESLEIHYGVRHPELSNEKWKPLYSESALLQAREEGRRAWLLEAAEIVLNGRFLHDNAPAKLFANEAAAAITRAAEGK